MRRPGNFEMEVSPLWQEYILYLEAERASFIAYVREMSRRIGIAKDEDSRARCPHMPSSGYRSSGQHVPCGAYIVRNGMCAKHADQADRLTAGSREPT